MLIPLCQSGYQTGMKQAKLLLTKMEQFRSYNDGQGLDPLEFQSKVRLHYHLLARLDKSQEELLHYPRNLRRRWR